MLFVCTHMHIVGVTMHKSYYSVCISWCVAGCAVTCVCGVCMCACVHKWITV